jgi:hypothetical protein
MAAIGRDAPFRMHPEAGFCEFLAEPDRMPGRVV